MSKSLLRKISAAAAIIIMLAFKADDKVYICISPGASKYHSHYCQGLKKCSHEVKSVTVKQAVDKGYGPCGYCY
ncbi:MAG: hypothetical protein KA149_02820 [Chitinophagales bacterium]|nr:hypothetical protein [Chitinophagales bacterium]